MNDNQRPSQADCYEALAGDARAAAHQTTDPETAHILRKIALGYDRLAILCLERELSAERTWVGSLRSEQGAA